jgi:5'-3' exoribonuclease 1
MNESGELNLPRFEIYLTELAKLDHQRYADDNDTFKNLNKLTGRKKNFSENKSPIDNDGFNFAVLDKLTDDTPLPPIIEKPDSTNENLESDDNDLLSDSDTISEKSNDDEDDEKKSSSTITKLINEDDIDKMPLIEAEFRQHKNHYYRDKMKINLVSSTQLQIYVEQYIEALQWILRYYYQGCPSWSWFYPHHYAPYLSDLNNFKDLKITLQKGTPFKPFEQLLSM